ncbi:hypothetical protein [Caulobacter sp. UNC279MFTsu5.1]|uniref:hypothetical protein n=1 Tax=Caulobacter sp. UNC279MFTsu5.1 TaxID=1502775 RepID=UPI00037065CD|nr:hypothetical protein [Caulobacter sp. UNC279MFTsu5.1]
MIIGLALVALELGQAPLVPYDPSGEAKARVAARTSGRNTVEGDALLRTVGGNVKTCAGFVAHLIPVRAEVRAGVEKAYGSAEAGFLSADRVTGGSGPLESQLLAEGQAVPCDAAGHFRFEGVPDGTYYAQARVQWSVPTRSWGGRYHLEAEGGFLIQRLTVEGGETKRLVLTN